MYFSASERFAEQQPAFRAVVEACDAALGRLPVEAVHTLRQLAERCGCDEYQLERVLDAFEKDGIVAKSECKMCSECETANSQRATRCTRCAESLAGAKLESLYTLLRLADRPVTQAADPTASIVDAQGKPRATVGIITALMKEFAAVADVLGLKDEWDAPGLSAGQRFKYGAVKGRNGGTHIIVAVLMPVTGNNSAATIASKLLHHFQDLPHVIMCGIAGGIRDDRSPECDVRLGDVVICDKFGVVQFDLGKDEGGSWKPTFHPRPPSAQLLEAANYMGAEELLDERPWETYLPMAEQRNRSKRPADDAGAKPGTVINYPSNPERRAGSPQVLHGTIASSNTLLKHAHRRDELREQHRVLAVEMEGSGVADATWIEGRGGYLVVRGIVDFADSNKGDVWHGYAAYSVASVVRALLESMPASG